MTSENSGTSVTRKPVLEVCVGSLDDALAAQAGGADRLELCGALELGGLTPTVGLVRQVLAETTLPVVVMIRPRAGGFAYSKNETQCMLADAEQLLEAGANGIVLGMLDASGVIDSEQLKLFTKLAADRQTVFHRAFDAVVDQESALAALIELGFDRVLTSGGAPTAIEDIDKLQALHIAANGEIDIMPGGGITAANAAQIIEHTGVHQLHIGASSGRVDQSVTSEFSAKLNDLGRLSTGEYRGVDDQAVSQVRQEIDRPSIC